MPREIHHVDCAPCIHPAVHVDEVRVVLCFLWTLAIWNASADHSRQMILAVLPFASDNSVYCEREIGDLATFGLVSGLGSAL